MSNNPVTNAFFFFRALAEIMSEKLEESFTSTMSDLGKFDAEQRENLRQFMEEVQLRAERASGTTVYPNSSNNGSRTTSSYRGVNIDISSTNSEDLQTMLDQLRAEIATLRTELKKYRN